MTIFPEFEVGIKSSNVLSGNFSFITSSGLSLPSGLTLNSNGAAAD